MVSLVSAPAPELGVITPDPPLPPRSFPTTEVVLTTGVRVGLGLGVAVGLRVGVAVGSTNSGPIPLPTGFKGIGTLTGVRAALA